MPYPRVFLVVSMKTPQTLLLAYHGTPGSELAEALAFEIAVPGATRLFHLLVVPDFWAGMQGDDWLNNASTRDAFGDYVENLLDAEAAAVVRGVQQRCQERGLEHAVQVRFGDPAACLVETAQAQNADLVVIGPPRPKGTPGYRSRMELETLVRELTVPLLMAPRQP